MDFPAFSIGTTHNPDVKMNYIKKHNYFIIIPVFGKSFNKKA